VVAIEDGVKKAVESSGVLTSWHRMTVLESTGKPVSEPNPASSGRACRTGMCSVGLMKSFCPSCLLIGLVLFPFELGVRWIRRLGIDRHTDG